MITALSSVDYQCDQFAAMVRSRCALGLIECLLSEPKKKNVMQEEENQWAGRGFAAF